MWSSITSFYQPENLQEAWNLKSDANTEFLAGGSYLVSEKDPCITALIDIWPLLENGISVTDERIVIHAGATLQQLYAEFAGKPCLWLSKAAFDACPSKNIRNQRTVGGEISRMRIGSETVSLLYALGTELTIYNGAEFSCPVMEWDGSGIILSLSILKRRVGSAWQERFSLLPTAPDFLNVAAVRDSDNIQVVVGGQMPELAFGLFETGYFKNTKPGLIVDSLDVKFIKDHYGSVEYKKSLLGTALGRIGEKLC